MGGLLVLMAIVLWGWFALWLGKRISRLFARFTFNKTTGRPHLWHTPVKVLCIVFVFMLPFMDQLIVWPKWQQMCATTGDFEWGPGMDEKKAFGREVVTKSERHEIIIFPNIKVRYWSDRMYDSKSGELVIEKLHDNYHAEGFMYIPSDSGDKTAIFLPNCATYRYIQNGQDLIKKLHITEVNEERK